MKKIILAIVLFLFLTPSLMAQENFETLVEAGAAAYNNKDFKTAIEKFKAAIEVKEHKDLYYNIARSYHALDQCEQAISNYMRYKELTRGENNVTRRIDKYLAELSDCYSLGKVQLTCSPASTRVYVNYNNNEYTCMNEIKLRAGNRTLTFEAPGYETQTRTINVTKGETTKLAISLDGKSLPEEEEQLKLYDKSEDPALILPPQSTPNYLAIGLSVGAAVFAGTAVALHFANTDDSDALFYTAISLDIGAIIASTTAAVLLIADINPSESVSAYQPQIEVSEDRLTIGISGRF